MYYGAFTRKIICLIICASCLGSVFHISTAATSKVLIESLPTYMDQEEINTIISENVNEKAVEEFFKASDPRYRPTDYWMDLSCYLVEYSVSHSFFDDFQKMNNEYTSLSNLLSAHPTIYIPLYSKINGSPRVIGHCKLYYNTSKQQYVTRTSLMNVANPEFISGELKHFYETTVGCLSECNITTVVDEVILLRLSTAYNDYSEKIAFFNTNNGLLVLDFYNSANNPAVSSNLYDFNDYHVFRSKYENELYGNQNQTKENLVAGGKGDTHEKMSSSGTDSRFWLLLVIVLLVCGTGFVILRYKKQKKF